MSGYKVNFSASDAGFSGTVSKIKSSLNSMDDNVKKAEKSMSSSFAGMAKAGAAFAGGMLTINAAISAAQSAADSFGAAMDMGGALADLSARTGESAGNLLILQRAFDNTGAGAEKVGPTINKLQKALVEAGQGSQSNIDAFNRLGINFTELASKTPTEQLQELAAKLSGVTDPAERSTLAMQLLGKSGGELLPFLSGFSEEIATAKGQLGSLPEVMDRSASAFDNLGDGIAVVKGKATELAAGFLESLLPALNSLVSAGSNFDAATLGQKFGMAVAPIVETIANGDMWELFTLQGKNAIDQIRQSEELNSLVAYLNTIADSFNPFADNQYDLLGNFAKYRDAGIQAHQQIADASQSALDQFWQKQGDRAKEAAAKFNKELAKKEAEQSAEDIYAKIFGDEAKVKAASEKAAEDIYGELFKQQDDAAKLMENSTAGIKDNLKEGADAMTVAADRIKETLSLSEQIVNRINDAEERSRVDPGGKLENRVNDAINQGNFSKARREAKKLKDAEDEKKVRDFFTDDPFKATKGKIKMSLKDLARKEGVETFGKTPDEIRDALLEKMKEREKGLDAKNRGKTKEEAAKDGKGQPALDPMKVITSTVQEIKQLLAKIEPKLPTAALGA
jgi:hypothetical protein